MSGTRPSLRPEPGGRGLASTDPLDVAELVLAAWDELTALAGTVSLEAPSRVEGWTVRDVLVHLGTWPEHTRFASMLDDARHDRAHDVEDVDARNAMLVAAHHDADRTEIITALRTAQAAALDFLASPEAELIGRRPVASRIGAMPVTAVIAASAYELAVHALDIADPQEVSPRLLTAGVGALVDTTAALAAGAGVEATFAVVTPTGSWAGGTSGDQWTTIRLNPDVAPVHDLGWPCVEGTAPDILDASAGRRSATHLVLTRRLRLRHAAGLLTLLPALEAVPGLPGGQGLRAAARALGQTARVVDHMASLVRR